MHNGFFKKKKEKRKREAKYSHYKKKFGPETFVRSNPPIRFPKMTLDM